MGCSPPIASLTARLRRRPLLLAWKQYALEPRGPRLRMLAHRATPPPSCLSHEAEHPFKAPATESVPQTKVYCTVPLIVP